MAFLLPVIFEVAECLFGAATVAAEGAAIGVETATTTEALETESLASNYLEINESISSRPTGNGLGWASSGSQSSLMQLRATLSGETSTQLCTVFTISNATSMHWSSVF